MVIRLEEEIKVMEKIREQYPSESTISEVHDNLIRKKIQQENGTEKILRN